MPELPEVEVIRRGFGGLIVGKKIVKGEVLCEKSWRGEVGNVVGGRVTEVLRKGKALLIEMDYRNKSGNDDGASGNDDGASGNDGLTLMVHLRMTGQLVYVGKKRFAGGHPTEGFVHELPDKHTRVIFEFSDDSHLYFNDQRKFGFVKVLLPGESDGFLEKLAPEPENMSEKEFYERLQRRKNTSVKAAILDQSVIAGVGNIYADEGLWAARIAPMRKAGEVSEAEAGRLLKGICEAMSKSIESGGSTIANYVKADGTRGDYLLKFAKVFGRTGEKCERCGGVIEKTRVAGRGTHWCPKCTK